MPVKKTSKPLFSFKDQVNYRRFREVLRSTGFTEQSILEILNIKDLPALGERDSALLLKRTRHGTPLETLIRLFLIEAPCSIQNVRKALEPFPMEVLIEADLIRVEKTTVYGLVKLLPFKGFIIAFDQPRILLGDLAPEYVMGIGSSTITLANLTVRRPIQKALDLGTGCGIQALLAGEHSEQVWATDQNPRAVCLADFNARLNGMDHINCIQGDLFEPVPDQQFDLIITNPPFVISPENRYIYRDGGMAGDELIKKIARQAPDYLSEGGYCHILCNWAEEADQDWKERLRSWFERTPCNVWVIRSETRDAGTYASTWIRHTEKKAVDDFERRFEEWTDYYERQSIRSIGAGMITLRKSPGRSVWFRAEDGPERMNGNCGEDIAMGFALQDYLKSVPEDIDLMQSVLQVSPKTRLDRESIPTDEGWMDQSFRLRISDGLAYSANVDPIVANLLVKCNGRTPLNHLVYQAAAALNEPVEKLTSPLCGIVRSLIAQGFLLPIHLAQTNASTESFNGRTRDTTTS
jgi:hypothetical protein